jgi:hypothetical protein
MKWNYSKWFAVMSVALATSGYAQKEQWLQYHTSREGRGYRWLELTTTAPANVTLPKLTSQPYFARWTSPLDPSGGRWLCFDRSKKSGPYDKLFIDMHGDGKLDAQPAAGIWQSDQYSSYFEPAKVVFRGEDGPVTYHITARFMKYEGESEPRVLASSGGFYSGDVDFGGKKRRIELIDANVNGTFNDMPFDADWIKVDGDKVGEKYLGKLLEVDGAFYRIEVARDGACVKVQKAEKVTLGKVRVPEGISQFVAWGENGQFHRKPLKGELTLPTGNYRAQEWTLNRKDSKGAEWDLTGSFGQTFAFEVVEGKTANLEIAEPIRMSLTATDNTNGCDFSLSFIGRAGESIQVMKGGARPPGPKLVLASSDGTYRSTNTFEFG